MKRTLTKDYYEFRGDITCERMLNKLDNITKSSQLPAYILTYEESSPPSKYYKA